MQDFRGGACIMSYPFLRGVFSVYAGHAYDPETSSERETYVLVYALEGLSAGEALAYVLDVQAVWTYGQEVPLAARVRALARM